MVQDYQHPAFNCAHIELDRHSCRIGQRKQQGALTRHIRAIGNGPQEIQNQ